LSSRDYLNKNESLTNYANHSMEFEASHTAAQHEYGANDEDQASTKPRPNRQISGEGQAII
jgi:hypothetical protein